MENWHKDLWMYYQWNKLPSLSKMMIILKVLAPGTSLDPA